MYMNSSSVNWQRNTNHNEYAATMISPDVRPRYREPMTGGICDNYEFKLTKII